MTDIEGEADDESNESNENEDDLSNITNTFTTLLADIDDIKEQFSSWFTSIESLLAALALVILIEMANTLVDDLNSFSLVHQLTGHNPTLTLDELPVEDAHTFAVEGTSRYDSRRFYGIVINIGTSKYLTADFDQF